jgi:hypothetical protein
MRMVFGFCLKRKSPRKPPRAATAPKPKKMYASQPTSNMIRITVAYFKSRALSIPTFTWSTAAMVIMKHTSAKWTLVAATRSFKRMASARPKTSHIT